MRHQGTQINDQSNAAQRYDQFPEQSDPLPEQTTQLAEQSDQRPVHLGTRDRQDGKSFEIGR